MTKRSPPHSSQRLTDESLQVGLDFLSQQDSDLARVLVAYGAPPLWARETGFATLVQIILEQQVSLSSARAAFGRLQGAVSKLEPEKFLKLGDAQLKEIGFSRQKSRYCRELSVAIVENRFAIDALEAMSDDDAKHELMTLKGIGRWTAEIYLLMALRRPDIWPSGDLALAKAAQQVKALDAIPEQDELEALAQAWRPWRAVAARLLWHHYLSNLADRQWQRS